MPLLKFENTRTKINSISSGKDQWLKILQKYGQESNEDILCEIEHKIQTISDKENVDNFNLHRDIRELIDNEDTYSRLVYELDRRSEIDGRFGKCFMYHAKNTLRKWDTRTNGFNRAASVIHNYFQLVPKQPDRKDNVSDTNTKYDSIMSKMYLSKYNKYVDANDNGAGAWTFQSTATYLFITDMLYRLLQPYITDVFSFFCNCIVDLNPIITGITYTTELPSEINALEFIYELMQLTSAGSYLTIKKNEDKSEVVFIYTTEKGTFTNHERPRHSTKYRLDKNKKRKVEVTITGSGNKLFFKVDVVGLQCINDITEMACNPELFSFNTDENFLEAMTYNILGTVLSHTKQFQTDYANFREETMVLVNSGKVRGIGSKKDTIRYWTEGLIRDNVFKSLKHECLLRPLMALQKEFPQQRYNVIYYRYVVSALCMTEHEISEMLRPLGSKQRADIRKMIKYVKSLDYTGIPALHYLYKAVTYRS